MPETIARFLSEAAPFVPLALKPATPPQSFEAIRTPSVLLSYERDPDWRLAAIASRYPRFTTDRKVAENQNLEWVTPGHPLFEAVRRHIRVKATDSLAKGACFYSLQHASPARVDFYRARVVDGTGQIIHERLFAVVLGESDGPRLAEPGLLGDFQPAPAATTVPEAALMPEATDFLHAEALAAFLDDVRRDRKAEIARIREHVDGSLKELIQRADWEIGRVQEDVEQGLPGAEGRLARAEARHDELTTHRVQRRAVFDREEALSLQAVERLASVLILPHPEREAPEVRNLRQDLETEATAMRMAMAYERENGREPTDVSAKNLGYDITSLDHSSGELRLIEVKGIGGSKGTVLLTPNERRVAEDRRDCYWLYVVTDCDAAPRLQEPRRDPAALAWEKVTKVAHYALSVSAISGGGQ